MKNVAWCLGALVTLISLSTACKKDCKPADPVVVHDTVTVTPPPGCIPNLSKGLLAYYPFNGNFNDESGNGLTAISKNGAFLTSDFVGRTNSCAGFDGINDYLIVPASSKLNADTITVSLQLMANNTNRLFAAISRVNFENAQGVAWDLHNSSVQLGVPDNFWTFSVPTNTDACSTIYTNRENSFYAFSKGPIKAGRWYNIVASFVGGVQKIYVNGVLEVTKTRTMTSLKKCNDADLVIGGWWKSDIMSIDGKIDDVRLYNRQLNECEIAKLSETFTD